MLLWHVVCKMFHCFFSLRVCEVRLLNVGVCFLHSVSWRSPSQRRCTSSSSMERDVEVVMEAGGAGAVEVSERLHVCRAVWIWSSSGKRCENWCESVRRQPILGVSSDDRSETPQFIWDAQHGFFPQLIPASCSWKFHNLCFKTKFKTVTAHLKVGYLVPLRQGACLALVYTV